MYQQYIEIIVPYAKGMCAARKGNCPVGATAYHPPWLKPGAPRRFWWVSPACLEAAQLGLFVGD